MSDIQYIGEHLIYGQIGHILVVLSFVASLFGLISYFFATQNRDNSNRNSWNTMGRWGFIFHAISVLSVIGIVFYLMINKHYEYAYVFQHVSEDLPFKYVFSAFWEGQEGSFLLWMFWHIILATLILIKGGQWEAPVMFCILVIQLFIGTMILGVHFGEYKIGSSLMVLFRDTQALPLFNSEDYVAQLSQFANGLNPLLQNYWMTIHPPTLFLGFASVSMPFAFAISGLWLGKHKEWLKPALRWSLFSAAILGTGILMGGAWAYEALSFGGYWAWDPVENTSLVPWLVMIAGVHTNLVARSTGYSIRTTYLFYILSFLLIVYSTTLTRSGVLGDTSVHAFTEMGLENQLLIFIGTLTIGSILMMWYGFKTVDNPEKEETFFSKEFWMFIGSLVLLFSAGLITFTTSIPVYNKVAELFGFNLGLTTPVEPIAHYNKYQLWIAVFIAVLSGIAQWMRYREFNWQNRWKKLLPHFLAAFIIAIIATYICTFWIDTNAWQYNVLLFCSFFGIISTLDVLIFFPIKNKKWAPFLAHAGFSIMLIGILASGLNKKHISTNPFAQRGLLPEDMLGKNVLLLKESPMFINGYEVEYLRDSIVDNTRYFIVNYTRLGSRGEKLEQFQLTPNALYDNKFTKIAAYNPSTKRYLERDIFSHIAGLAPGEGDIEEAKAKEDSLNYQVYNPFLGKDFFFKDTVEVTEDSFYVKEFRARVLNVIDHPEHEEYEAETGDIAMALDMEVEYLEKDTIYNAKPMIVLRSALLYNFPSQINDLALKIKLSEESLANVFTPEEEILYKEFSLKQGESLSFNGYKMTFEEFDKKPQHRDYKAQEGDIAVSAIIKVEKDSLQKELKPVYLIRGNSPFNLKDVWMQEGLHVRFVHIKPKDGTIMLAVGQQNPADQMQLEIATNSFRTDYIVLEAIEFPGINLFWLGSVMMMMGLFVGMFQKIRKNAN